MLWNRLQEILKHPLNRDRKLAALSRYARWHVGSRMQPGAVLVPFVNNTVLAVSPREPGDLANYFMGLPDFEDCAFLLHLLREGDVFADVGANAGSYTVLAAGVCGATVVAVEPVPATFERLMRNVAVNGLSGRVAACMCGVGAVEETLRFTTENDQRNQVAHAEYRGATIEVPVRPLDVVLDGMVPKLMKLDVEGWEPQVLQGAQRTLANEALKGLIVEMKSDAHNLTKNDAAVHAMLTEQGFAPHAYDPMRRTLRALSGKNPDCINTLYLRDAEALAVGVQQAPAFTVAGRQI